MVFSPADWETFKQINDKEMEKVDVSQDVDELNILVLTLTPALVSG